MQKSKKRYHQVSYLKQKIIEKLSISLFSFCSPLDGGLDNAKCLIYAWFICFAFESYKKAPKNGKKM